MNPENAEILLIGGAIVKMLVDLFAPFISKDARPYIPFLAIVIGLSWSLAFNESELAYQIYDGITIGFTAVAVNEIKKKMELLASNAQSKMKTKQNKRVVVEREDVKEVEGNESLSDTVKSLLSNVK
ncbi:MAG: hypothetical protein ACPG5V_00855 [Vibrio cyclitrophicus]